MRVAVQADVEHRRIALEGVLRAVAMMHVEIEDQEALDFVLILQRARRHRDVIEQAEARGPVGLGVMSGRANSRRTRV